MLFFSKCNKTNVLKVLEFKIEVERLIVDFWNCPFQNNVL